MVTSSVGKVAADPTARIAVLGRGLVPAGDPVLRGDDLGVLHGDGLFETMHLRDGRPWLRDEHLARLAAAAARRRPAAAPRRRAGRPARPGRAPAGRPRSRGRCGWSAPGARRPAARRPSTPRWPRCRRPSRARPAGRDHRGHPAARACAADARAGLDWLPAGIKSTSYAVNSAARRWAAGAGVDDVLWISSDGYALEGPTANAGLARPATRSARCRPRRPASSPAPPPPGCSPTPASWACAPPSGWSPRPSCTRADGVWLTSSVRGAAEVHTLDGVRRARCPHTPALQALLGFPARRPPTVESAADPERGGRRGAG